MASERQSRARRASAKATAPSSNDNGRHEPEEAGAPAEPVIQGLPDQHPGIVILRVPVPEQPGNEQVQIIPINGLDPMAIPTLLEYAQKIHRQNLGL